MAIAQEDMAVLDFADPQADYAALEEDIAGLPLVSERPLQGNSPPARDAAVLAGRLRRSRRGGAHGEPGGRRGRDRSRDARARRQRAVSRRAARSAGSRRRCSRISMPRFARTTKRCAPASSRPDVAFNYELAVRMREEVGAGKRKALTNAKPTTRKPIRTCTAIPASRRRT